VRRARVRLEGRANALTIWVGVTRAGFSNGRPAGPRGGAERANDRSGPVDVVTSVEVV